MNKYSCVRVCKCVCVVICARVCACVCVCMCAFIFMYIYIRTSFWEGIVQKVINGRIHRHVLIALHQDPIHPQRFDRPGDSSCCSSGVCCCSDSWTMLQRGRVCCGDLRSVLQWLEKYAAVIWGVCSCSDLYGACGKRCTEYGAAIDWCWLAFHTNLVRGFSSKVMNFQNKGQFWYKLLPN